MIIGQIENYNINYNQEKDSISCKNLNCYAKDIVEAYESLNDRSVIPNTSKKKLIMRKADNSIRVGCFTLTLEQSKNLIKNIKNARSKKQNNSVR